MLDNDGAFNVDFLLLFVEEVSSFCSTLVVPVSTSFFSLLLRLVAKLDGFTNVSNMSSSSLSGTIDSCFLDGISTVFFVDATALFFSGVAAVSLLTAAGSSSLSSLTFAFFAILLNSPLLFRSSGLIVRFLMIFFGFFSSTGSSSSSSASAVAFFFSSFSSSCSFATVDCGSLGGVNLLCAIESGGFSGSKKTSLTTVAVLFAVFSASLTSLLVADFVESIVGMALFCFS
jgi:hypothetical protein